MQPDRPLTAREAALQDAKADKLPLNPEADKRHVIASAMRRIGELTGHSEQGAQAGDEFQAIPITPGDAGQQGMLGGPAQQPQTAPDWAALSNAPAAGDLSLADMIIADQAASRGFALPPAMSAEDGTPSPLGPSFDALQSTSWMAAAFDTQADTSPPESAFPPLAQFIDATTSPSIAPDLAPFNMPFGTPGESPLIDNSQFDASARGIFNTPSLDPTSSPSANDLVYHYDAADPGSIVQPPYNPADAAPEDESRAPITYLPFGESAAASHAPSGPVEKLRVEIELSIANVQKNSVLAYLAMEPAILKAIDQAGEQDRHDAFMRESSRRACL
jgi:hypothetical protein